MSYVYKSMKRGLGRHNLCNIISGHGKMISGDLNADRTPSSILYIFAGRNPEVPKK